VKVICSYCSAAKRLDEEPLPALVRYRSERLRKLWAQGRATGTPLFILSGEYGLLAAESPIPWYDHLLAPEEVAPLALRVAAQLRAAGITELEYHTATPAVAPAVAPYLAVARSACERAGASLAVVELPGDPA